MGIQQMIMAAGGLDQYLVDNSLRFNPDDSAYLSWTPSSAGNRETWTWSGWVKRSKIDATRRTLIRTNSTETHISFAETAQGNAEALLVYGAGAYLITTPVYNDASVWYHIVLAWDTTQATSTDRIKIYVNGVQITSFNSSTYPSRYNDSGINAASAHGLGANSAGGELHDGYLADLHFVDGTALDASSFGETVDSSWVPKEFSGSHGTNGFHLKFNNTSDLGEDSSGNGNDWTANNFVASETLTPCVKFDGTGDYLDLGTSSDYAFGTGDFTIEMYVFRPNDGRSGHNTLFATRGPAGTSTGFNIGIFEDSGGRRLYMYSNGHRLTYANEVPEGWTHIAITRSGTSLKSFINGVLEGTGTTSENYTNNSATIASVWAGGAENTLGFISDFRIIKGTALYTANFTPPTRPLTAVTNTKLLCCQSNTSATTDNSSSSHTITAYGNAAGTDHSNAENLDLLADSPTAYDDEGNGVGNYCTLNPLDNGGLTLSNGNLDFTNANTSWDICRSTFSVNSGQWYWEIQVASWFGAGAPFLFGIANQTQSVNAELGQTADSWAYLPTGQKRNSGSTSSYGGTAMSSWDIVGVALDMTSGTLTFYLNGVSQGQAFSSISGDISPAVSVISTSQWGGIFNINFGQRAFVYTPPTGYKALNSYNT